MVPLLGRVHQALDVLALAVENVLDACEIGLEVSEVRVSPCLALAVNEGLCWVHFTQDAVADIPRLRGKQIESVELVLHAHKVQLLILVGLNTVDQVLDVELVLSLQG